MDINYHLRNKYKNYLIMEIIICTINHSQYLKDTLIAFKNNININLEDCRLLINIDPFPDNKNTNDVIETAKSFCNKVECRIGTEFTAAAGLLWGINLLKNKSFFILGGGKTLIKKIDISYMETKLFAHDNAAQISTLNNEKKYIDYFTVTPCLCKTSWFKNIYMKYAVKHLEVEYQLRELALLDNKKCLSYSISNNVHEYYPKHIKSYDYKDEWKSIYSNKSSDEEINNIIKENGEWHQNIINNYIGFDTLNNVHKNFMTKSLDKEWIYRFTGYYGFIPKKNESFYKRHIFKSSFYECNKLSNLSLEEILKRKDINTNKSDLRTYLIK